MKLTLSAGTRFWRPMPDRTAIDVAAFDAFHLGNRRAPCVLIFTENVNATYFISFEIPLLPLYEQGTVNFATLSQQKIKAIPGKGRHAFLGKVLAAVRPDAVIMTCYGEPYGQQIMAFFQEAGVPVIYHIDDDLLDIPPSLGKEISARQGAEAIVATRRALISKADLVYASTAELHAQLAQKIPEANVLHGAIYTSYMGDFLSSVERPSQRNVIGYMGSKGHGEDLALVVPALVRVMEEHPDLQFELFGTIQMPAELERFGNRVSTHRVQVSYREFLQTLKGLGWKFGLAPLVDEPFNRCKAPTKLIEYTASGIPVLASDMVVYNKAVPPEAATFVSDGAWYQAMTKALADTSGLLEQQCRAHEYCAKRFSLHALQAQIGEALRYVGVPSKMKLLFHREKAIALSRAVIGRIFGYASPHVSMNREGARTRVLFVANDFIPTLQLSFIKPLRSLVESGEMAIDVLSERQMSNVFGRKRRGWVALQWVLSRVRRFNPTVVVFCRYSGPHANALRDYASENGIPVVYHIDDDLLNVPEELGEEKFAYHNQPHRLEAVRYLLAESDLVYFSTEKLRARMQRHCANSQTYAGDIYCSGEVVERAESRKATKVGYMGFDHAHDFEIALPAIIEMLDTYPSVSFELFGSIPLPEGLRRFGARVGVIPPVRGYGEFMKRLASLKWDIGICPLEKSEFNSVKANTKWVEYTAAGAAVIASSSTVYDDCCANGCGMLVDHSSEWAVALSHLIESDQERYEMVRAAQRKLENEYSVSKLREQVTRVLERAMHSRRLPT